MQRNKSRPAGAAGIARSNVSDDTPVDRVLHRLEKVKSTGPGKWIALCPAHDDKRPSLSIREADDHRVLLKCWTGCGAAEIVSALGLSLADLFPQDRRNLSEHSTGPTRRPFDCRDALKGVSHEITVARLIVEAVNAGQEMDVESLTRLAQAEQRISDALRIAGGAS